MAIAGVNEAASRPRHRTVVLLRETEREKVERLAHTEGISIGEVIRRSVARYQADDELEDKQASLDIVLDALNAHVDQALASVERANAALDEALGEEP